jgi:hypothetical protein
MRESERNTGRADHNLAGARSAAEGETQEPEKVIDERAVERSERAGEAVNGSEGGGGDTSPADASTAKRRG